MEYTTVPFDLRQLRYFVTVVDEGQLTRAAAKLHLAQPALSQAIAQLERELGVVLLRRHAKGVEPTSVGQLFAQKARSALAAANDAERAVAGWVRTDAGKLATGFLSMTPPAMAADVLKEFTSACPAAELDWRELGLPTVDRLAWLDGVDLALTFAAAEPPELSMQPIRLMPRVLATAEEHPLARRSELRVEDVLDETFPGVAPGCSSAWWEYWTLDEYRGGPARLTRDLARTPQEVAAIVLSGRAVITTPAPVAAQLAHLGVASIPIIDASPAVLALVWKSDSRNPLVEALAVAARSTSEGFETGDSDRAGT